MVAFGRGRMTRDRVRAQTDNEITQNRETVRRSTTTTHLYRWLVVLLRCRKATISISVKLSTTAPRTHRYPVTQRERDALRLAPDTHMPDDAASVCPLDAQIRQRILAYATLSVHVPYLAPLCRAPCFHSPNRLRAYMFADRKSQSPEIAPSGVRHDMFVAFMTWRRYSLGSLCAL